MGVQEKRMARRAFMTVYIHEKCFRKIPTVLEVQKDMEDSGLGRPSLTRLREALKKDRRTIMVKRDQWRVKTAEVDDEISDLYKISKVEKQTIIKTPKRNVSLLAAHKLHPKVELVSADQFASGYYKEAVQNALVEVIHQVKVRSGNPTDNQGGELDGDKLMQRAFGADVQRPIITFNSLQNSLDRAEQRGLMYLYKGIVGIRDRKAHLNFIQRDPVKALEYLSLASLLLRLLDENTPSTKE
ncbi:MAG: TIGR02391 family protein [Patescibacteria group bacterium]